MSVFPFNKGGGAWDGQTPVKVNVIVIYAGFGDATLLEVINDKGRCSEVTITVDISGINLFGIGLLHAPLYCMIVYLSQCLHFYRCNQTCDNMLCYECINNIVDIMLDEVADVIQ